MKKSGFAVCSRWRWNPCGANASERESKFNLRLFEIYDLEDARSRPGYEDLAREFGIAVTDVTNYLAFARREFRRIVLAKLREMCAREEEFRREARAILGVDPG